MIHRSDHQTLIQKAQALQREIDELLRPGTDEKEGSRHLFDSLTARRQEVPNLPQFAEGKNFGELA